MEIYFLIVFLILGTVLGSFFNVVGLRVPKKITFTNDRSYCPKCNKTLRWYELVPVVSYVLQAGKCRSCKSKISFLYPFIESMTGFLFAFAYYKIGFQLELIVVLVVICMVMILFVTDMAYMRIPNKILLFFLPLIIILRIVAPLDPWYNAILGAVVGYVLVALIIILSKGGMGAGDMKLLGVLGIFLGLAKVLVTFFVAALIGALVGGAFMLVGKVKRKQAIPFGPYLIVATIVTYFYGDKLINWYLSFL